MKITLEIPDTTACAFVNYVFVNEKGNMAMAVKSYGTNDFENSLQEEKGGDEEWK